MDIIELKKDVEVAGCFFLSITVSYTAVSDTNFSLIRCNKFLLQLNQASVKTKEVIDL